MQPVPMIVRVLVLVNYRIAYNQRTVLVLVRGSRSGVWYSYSYEYPIPVCPMRCKIRTRTVPVHRTRTVPVQCRLRRR
eukprot:scaffold572274_cov19-Prasinocladus_malaysianus.AAC.1